MKGPRVIGIEIRVQRKQLQESRNMWNDCSDDTRDFPNIIKIDKNDIEGASETQLATSHTVFSTWMLSQSRTALDGKKIYFGVQK